MKHRPMSPTEVMYYWGDLANRPPDDEATVVPLRTFTWSMYGGPMGFRVGVPQSVRDPQARAQMRELGLIR